MIVRADPESYCYRRSIPQLIGNTDSTNSKEGDTIVNAVIVKTDGSLFFGGSTDSTGMTGEATKIKRPFLRWRRHKQEDSGDDSLWVIKNAGSYNWKEVTSIIETNDDDYYNRFYVVIRSHTANAKQLLLSIRQDQSAKLHANYANLLDAVSSVPIYQKQHAFFQRKHPYSYTYSCNNGQTCTFNGNGYPQYSVTGGQDASGKAVVEVWNHFRHKSGDSANPKFFNYRYRVRTADADSTYGVCHAVTAEYQDSSDTQYVWAAMTIKRSGNRHSMIVKFNQRDLNSRTLAHSYDALANEYARADILTSYGITGRVIGIGRRYNGNSDTPASSTYISIFVERHQNDRYFYKEIDTKRNRNNEEFLSVYRKSDTEIWFTMFEKSSKRLILNNLIVENTGSNSGSSVGYNEITVSLSEQWVDSYCRSGQSCNIMSAYFQTTAISRGTADMYLFYAGSTRQHISKTYTVDVGFVAARTNYKLYCWKTDSNNPLDSMTMSYTDITSGSGSYFTMRQDQTTAWEMQSVSESGYFEYQSTDSSGVQTSTSSFVTWKTSGISKNVDAINTADNDCNPYHDDVFFDYSRLSSSSVTGNSYTLKFNGLTTKLDRNLRDEVFWRHSLGNRFANTQCGYRTITYASSVTTQGIPSTQLIDFDITSPKQGKYTTPDVITYAKMGNQNVAENIYAISYHINSFMDSTRAGTTDKTWTSTYKIKFIYYCSPSGGGTIQSKSSVDYTQIYTPGDGSTLFEVTWPHRHYAGVNGGSDAVTVNGVSTRVCTIQNVELREDSTCATLQTKPLTDTGNFDMVAWTNAYPINDDTSRTKFKMNRNPSALWSKTKCLYMDNGHEVTRTTTLTARVICGHNTHYTVNQPSDLTAAARYVEEFIDTTGHTYTFSAFTSTGETLCPIQKYEVYKSGTNSISQLGYTGFTIPNALTRTVVIADSVFAGNLNDYTFYIRAEFLSNVDNTAYSYPNMHYGFSQPIAYKVVCGTETLSIQQFVENGATIDRYYYGYTHDGGPFNETSNTALLTRTYAKSIYQSWFLTDKPLCPADEWEIWKKDGSAQVDANDLISIDGYNAGKSYSVTIKTHNNASPTKNNWYDKFIIKGYTKARHNSQKPRTIVNQLWLYFDVCGWEVPSNPLDLTDGLIPRTIVLYIEEGKNRSNSYQFGEYTTTSTKYPSWHAQAGKEQCPITGYHLSKTPSVNTAYSAKENTESTYYQLLREWDDSLRKFKIDTADDTTKLTSETFYIEIRTRGNRNRFYQVDVTTICGQERIIYPKGKAYNFYVEQNATAPLTRYQVRGYTSTMPKNCDVIAYKIEKVIGEDGLEKPESYWKSRFSIDNKGVFEVLNTTQIINHMQFYISASTSVEKTPLNIHPLNVSVTPLIQTNPNIPPIFEGVQGKELEKIVLFVGDNYSKTPYKLPKVVDPDGNLVYIWLEQGRELTFMKFDNSTKQFNFKDFKIPINLAGTYKLIITLGDDNWKGPLTSNYTLPIEVKIPIKAIIEEPEEDKSFKGAKIVDMGISGGMKINFKEKMYINPLWIERSQKRLLNESATTNTTWVIKKEAPKRGKLPDKPVFDPKLIDKKVLDVRVDPSPYQDKSMTTLDWQTVRLTEDFMEIQVYFDNYEYISIEGLDEMVITVKDKEALLSQKDGAQLFNEGYSIRQPLRKQMPPPKKNTTDEEEKKKEESALEDLIIDTETYQRSIHRLEEISKRTIFAILVWSFISGSKNLDFLWSYIGTLQLLCHIILLKIQIPMNSIMMARSLLSVSLLDIQYIQNKFLDFTTYMPSMINIIKPKKVKNIVKGNVEQEISQYQFFEMGYKESLTFFENLRTSKFYFIMMGATWAFIIFLALIVFLRLWRCSRRPWLPRACLRRFWYYLGFNGFIRMLFSYYLLVIFAGYVVYRRQFIEYMNGDAKIEMDRELIVFASCLGLPLLLSFMVSFLSKDCLLNRFVSSNIDTLYYKSSLRFFSSRSFSFVLLLQKLAFAAIILYIEDIIIQTLVMILAMLIMSWIMNSIDQVHLDSHLKTFERFNQGLLSLVQISLVLFTDFVPARSQQFKFGYFYALLMLLFNFFGLLVATIYAFEPIFTWVRLTFMRLHQIELAVKLRATLIREAKERKEMRKQKKIAAFNNFKIDIEDKEEEKDPLSDTDDESIARKKKKKKNRNKKSAQNTLLDIVYEENLEDTLTHNSKTGIFNEINTVLRDLEDEDERPNFGKMSQRSDSFDEEQYAEAINQISLIDRDQYVSLLKKKDKLTKMRQALVLADLDDDGDDLKESRKIAYGINEKFDNLLEEHQIKKQRQLLQEKQDLESAERNGPLSSRKMMENVEYHSLINALDNFIKDIQSQLQQLDEDNGVIFNTRGTEDQRKEEEKDDEPTLNIMDMFTVELNN